MTKNNNRFPNIECRLDNDGRNALKELQKKLSLSVTNAPDPSLAKFLEDVRNRGAFHYVRDHYQQGLRALKRDVERNPAHSVEAMEDCFIFEGIPVKGVWRFVFADTVRNAAAFGLNEAKGITEQLQANLEQVTALIGHLNQFLQSAFIAYVELRGFDVTKTNEGFKIHKKESP